MTARPELGELAAMFAEIGDELRRRDSGRAVLDVLVHEATARVGGAEEAGVTVARLDDHFETVAATSERVRTCDAIQYELNSGPCVDAITAQSSLRSGDLRTDERWPEFGPRSAQQTGIVSMLSMCFYAEDDGQMIAGLNLYSSEPESFDEHSEAVARLLCTHGSLALAKAAAEEKARNLTRALQNSRDIGTAMGILMAQEKVTREQAFDLLRMTSQRLHRKLSEVAGEVADTGLLPGQAPAAGRTPAATTPESLTTP